MATKEDPICVNALAGRSVMPGPKAQGVIEKVDDMDVYVVGKGPRCIVLVYDIFGFEPANTRHNCDILAEAGFLVVMADFFRGSGRGKEGFQRPNTPSVVAEVLEKVLPFAVTKGAKVLGVLGFCFGGAISMNLASTGRFASVGGIHSGALDVDGGVPLISKTTCPIMLCQAGNDPSLADIYALMKKLDPQISKNSVLRTYWDMNHGWCGATGDRSDPKIRCAVETTLQTTIEFFNRTLRVMNAE